MKVIIAEKPSVAREIAAIVGATGRKDGYIEGNGWAVTWAFGHLVGLAMPEAYGFTGFQRDNLPILPQEFKLIPRQIREGKEYRNDPGVMKQLKIIGELFSRADRLIVATDAGREGELIFRYVYTYLGCKKPFDRLWISSLTDRAIREGLQNLRPGTEYDNLYLAADARAKADWLVGINASQALSIAAGRGAWSLGRVQTPTLAIICARYLENKAFASQTYFQVKLHTAKDATAFAALSCDRFDTRNQGEEIARRIRAAGAATVVNVEKKTITEQPPLLYDLTALQKEMNTRYGFSADKTLEIAQKLYEAGLISYPRTGSRYISEDLLPEIYPLLNSLAGNPHFGYQATAVSNSELNGRPVDDKKVTDHHAILITGNEPKNLAKDESLVYERIAGRVVEAFSAPCVKDVTTVRIESDGVAFDARGTVIKSAAWRKVWQEKEEKEDDEAPAIPELKRGDTLTVRDAELLEKQTKPRPVHTESSLLAAMETAGRDLENEAEREAMKESGIGTPATRAAIIETLFARDYIRREKKSLVPTDKGLAVYGAVKDKKIADVAMTGGWELALSKIARGEMDAFTFHRGIEVYASQITSELLSAGIARTENRAGATCPRCAQPVVFYPKVAKCLNPDCGLTVFRAIAKKELTDAQLADLFGKGKTAVIKGFKGNSGNPFDAAIAFDANHKTVFEFAPKKKGKGNSRK